MPSFGPLAMRPTPMVVPPPATFSSTAGTLHRLTSEPPVLVDPFTPSGIVHGVILTHLRCERVESAFQPKQLLLSAVDIQVDRNVLRFLTAEQLAQKAHRSVLPGWGGLGLAPCDFSQGSATLT